MSPAFSSADTAVSGTLYYLPATPARDDAILPQRQLHARHPDLYARHVRKHADRPKALQQRIEPLDYARADVPHVLHRGPIPIAWFHRPA